jgi:hypothetical protein
MRIMKFSVNLKSIDVYLIFLAIKLLATRRNGTAFREDQSHEEGKQVGSNHVLTCQTARRTFRPWEESKRMET